MANLLILAFSGKQPLSCAVTTGLTGTYYISSVFTGQYGGSATRCLLRLVLSVQGVKCAKLSEVVSSENEFSNQGKILTLEINH